MIAVIADDLSGACECAGIASEYDFPIRVYFDASAEQGFSPKMQISVIDLDARHSEDGEAALKIEKALRRQSADFTYLKIDSAFRGPIGAMLATTAAELKLSQVVICCAVPYTNRWTVDGMQLIKGKPLGKTDFVKDPHHPAGESHLPTILESQIGERVTSASTADLEDESLATCKWLIADATSWADLENIAAFFKDKRFAAGAGGLWKAILEKNFGEKAHRQPRLSLPWKNPVVISGSMNPISRLQVERLKKSHPQITCIQPSSERMDPLEAMRKMTEEAKGHLLEGGAEGIIISGGHTARSILDLLRVKHLEVQGTLGGMVTEAQVVMDERDRTKVLIKPGSYGEEDFYDRVLL